MIKKAVLNSIIFKGVLFFIENEFQHENDHNSKNHPQIFPVLFVIEVLPDIIENASSQKYPKKYQRCIIYDCKSKKYVKKEMYQQEFNQRNPHLSYSEYQAK